MNPTMGAALEAAREAEAALLALEEHARGQRGNNGDGDSDACAESGDGTESTTSGPEAGTGPVHRVEIEAAEVVPSHSGRAARGFVARVHRAATTADGGTGVARGALTSPPETHVFSDHRDLVNFLGGELAKGQPGGSE
ncbi:MAG TPA: hypothetical protein VHX49_04330 [Candidatus Acidoferrales bacterium]|nr:hypothetical protein [Candidatus Acidoferrales bacterium]